MGQQQSSTHSETSPTRSYYESLEIAKTATEDDIKKAYRRRALELHPDRNYGNVEEATRLFAEIQTAYEVLSDPQERAWYDSHESAILSGSDIGRDSNHENTVTTSDDIARLYATFDGRKDFSDSSTGFFTSLRDIFDKLWTEEQIARESEGMEVVHYPSFGYSEDHVDSVKSFYDVWSGFSTKKTFAWKDVYRLSEAPDRRIRRAMEKENKRHREEAIKDFNYTVRTLVAFVKRRDPRVKASSQSDAQRNQSLREQAAAQAAKARAANQASFHDRPVPAWVSTQELGDGSDVDIWESDQDEPEEHFECVVCDKVFKTEKQYESHEKSKKHVQAVKKIQRQMRKEGIAFGLDRQNNATSNGKNHMKNNSTASSQGSPDEVGQELEQPTTRTPASGHIVPYEIETTHQEIEEGLDLNKLSADFKNSLEMHDDVKGRVGNSEKAAEDSEEELNGTAVGRPTTKGKAKAKRARKAMKELYHEETGYQCYACNDKFQSKNQLFRHLKEMPSHAKLGSNK